MNVMQRVSEHYNEALEHFQKSNVVGIFLQGSQNYGLDYSQSDVDTKLIVTPSIDDVVLNRSAISTTHVRANDEHIDFKDIRLMLQTFRKQNLNFIEILFTDYFILNEDYAEQWNRLVKRREDVARFNRYQAIKAMKGVAMEKFHAMEHRYPAKIEVIDKYGYDPKQLSHLVRVEDFLEAYLRDRPYEECLRPQRADFIMNIKLGKYNLESAREIAERSMARIEQLTLFQKGCAWDVCDPDVEWLLNDVQTKIVKSSFAKELNV